MSLYRESTIHTIYNQKVIEFWNIRLNRFSYLTSLSASKARIKKSESSLHRRCFLYPSLPFHNFFLIPHFSLPFQLAIAQASLAYSGFPYPLFLRSVMALTSAGIREILFGLSTLPPLNPAGNGT